LASDVSSAASVATASASAGLGSWLKKVAFRAAGEEGLAENVRNEKGEAFGIDAIHAAKDLKTREEIRYRDELRMIHCTDTSGQVFAILINCIYLAPLTWLFVRFFIRSYTRRGENQKDKSTKLQMIEESGKDAARDVKRELDQALNEQPGSTDDQDSTTASSGKKTKTDKPKQGSSEEQTGESDNNDGKDIQGTEGSKDGKGTGDSKKQNGAEKPGPGSGIGKGESGGRKTEDSEKNNEPGDKKKKPGEDETNKQVEDDHDNDDEDNDDVEILDSAEAVTDVLDTSTENAEKFSKDLENSKAG
jgi:GNS1/SUR4 family